MSNDIKNDKYLLITKPKLLTDTSMHYCPGCGHSTVHKIIAEVLEEMDIDNDNIIGVSSVGCSVFMYNYINIDWVSSAHGRAPAVATGIKRTNPQKLVFTYQGDGEIAAIGTGEIIHACNRSENIAIIFINNSVFGMTNGQMSPTTPLGMKTSTCPEGRNAQQHGFQLNIADFFSKIEGTCFVSRQTVSNYKAIKNTKKAIRKAFENSLCNKGTSVVEIVSACPTNWKMSPVEANKWIDLNSKKTFHLGDLKNK